jgi:uroporphyrinogen-III decarboxylase
VSKFIGYGNKDAVNALLKKNSVSFKEFADAFIKKGEVSFAH